MRKRLSLMLALLLIAATGAWAAAVAGETITLKCGSTVKTYENVTLPWSTTADILKQVITDMGNMMPPSIGTITEGDGKVVKNGNENFQVTGTFSGEATVAVTYYNSSMTSSTATITVTAPGAAGTSGSGDVKMAEGTEDAENWTLSDGTNTAKGNVGLTGVPEKTKVTATYGGTKKVKSVKAVKKAAAPAVKPVATVTTAPQAKTNVEAGSTTALIEAGVADGGTMMYAVTTENTKPNSTDGFSATVPTAQTCAAGTVYVWYYVKANDTHTDSEIAGPVSVTLAVILSESFTTNQGIETYDGNHFTITCITKGDSDGIEIEKSKPLTITAKNGETITKVEFHCTYGSGYASQTTVTAGTLNWTTNSATGSIDKVNASTVSMSNSTVDWVQINQITVYYAE